MKLLILDFLYRWRWLFAIALLLSLASGVMAFPIVFAPAAVVALLLDAERGVFRAVRPMPVSRHDQTRAWWIVGVPLLPLLSVPVLAIGVLIAQAIHAPSAFNAVAPPPPLEVRKEPIPIPSPQATDALVKDLRVIAPPIRSDMAPAPWFAAGVQAWVALGYAGFCFFLMQWVPTRPAENITENLGQGVLCLLWGVSMPGVVFVFPNLPRIPAAIAPWHWAVFVAAPIFVALSYLSAAALAQRRMFDTVGKARPQTHAQPVSARGGLEGVGLFVVNFAGRSVLIVAAGASIQTIFLWWMEGRKPALNDAVLVIQTATTGLMLAVLITESIGMRALRVLPLSTARLAVLLSLVSWAAALSIAALAVLGCGVGDPALPVWLNLASQSVALGGWASLTLAATLHVASSGRFFLLIAFVSIPATCIPKFATHTALFAAIGAVAGVAGFALLMRGLGKSSAFYRPRGFFGMTPGQPSAVR